MPVSSSIPNLVNGVSQQPASLRLSSQCEAQENCYSSVVEGLKKRPPTEHVAKLIDGPVGSAFLHTINRDETERYEVVITSGQIKVFDLQGNPKTVSTPDGVDYITVSEPGEALRAITINDFTFIVNTTKVTHMGAAMTATRGPEGLVFIRQGVGSQIYKIFLDGVEVATHTAAASPSTQVIAKALYDAAVTWNTANGNNYTIQTERSVIWFKRVNGADFELKIQEPAADAAMKAFKKSAQRFTDLPTVAPTGYVIEIVGDNSSNFDNYYVKFVPNNATATFDTGYWKETVAENIQKAFDPATMPHVLVREADGTFTFREVDWDERTAGDADTNPMPSFTGMVINDVFLHKNRLGFLSDTNAILSGAGDFFRFFRKTVVTLLDEDPIDISASHAKVSILRNTTPFNEKLLVFSDQTQFVLEGGDLLTPKSAALNLTTEFEASHKVRPVNAGTNVFFASRSGDWSSVHEFYQSANSVDANDAADVTAHVPKYIPADIIKLAAETNQNLLVAMCGSPVNDALYPYKYFWNGETKLQSAWGKWTFNGGQMLNVDFLTAELFMVVQRHDGVYLEKMRITPGITDPGTQYLTHLDRRVTNEQCSAVVYDPDTDMTFWTPPYAPAPGVDHRIVTRYVEGSGVVPGVLLQGVTVDGDTISARGNHLSTPVWIGENYVMAYTFSDINVKEQAPNGGEAIITEGRLQLLFMSLIYAGTSFFKVKVEYDHRPNNPSIYRFTGRILGSTHNRIGAVALEDGKYKFFVNSKADECSITIINDSYLPCAFQSAGWLGNLVIGSQRI